MFKNKTARNVTMFFSALALIGCTSSTQATRAMQIGGATLGFGLASFAIGYGTSTDDNLEDNATALVPMGAVIFAAGFWTLIVGAVSKPSLTRMENLNRELLYQGIILERLPTRSSRQTVPRNVPMRIPPSPDVNQRLTNEMGYITVSVPCYGPVIPALKVYDNDRTLLHVINSDLERDNYYYFPIDQDFIDLQGQDVFYEVCNRILHTNEYTQIPVF